MTRDKDWNLCTIDHSNKQSDAMDWNPYDYWLKQARRLKAAKQRQQSSEFRRDQPRAENAD